MSLMQEVAGLNNFIEYYLFFLNLVNLVKTFWEESNVILISYAMLSLPLTKILSGYNILLFAAPN